MRRLVVAIMFAGLGQAHASGVTAVSPLPGYACKVLKMTETEAFSPRGVPIRIAPDPAAPVGTTASSVLLVRSPLHVVDGFVEVMQLNGQPGWIEQSRVLPFDPNRRCVPSMMSNGRPGIG